MFPSLITASRVVFAVFAFKEIMEKKFFGAAVFVALGALTDFLDGYLARKMGKKTSFGAHFDHISDKFFVLLVLTGFFLKGVVGLLPLALLAVREVGITLLRIYGLAGGVNTFGKLKTAVEFAALIALCLNPQMGKPLLWLAIILAYLSAYEYIRPRLKLPPLPGAHLL